MAGEIERFVSPSMPFKVKPAKSIRYHDELISPRNTRAVMEDYFSGDLNEEALINFLLSEDKQLKALVYLEQLLQDSNGDFPIRNKRSLFNGLAKALTSSNLKVAIRCTKLLSKIVPQLGVNVDSHVGQLLPSVISNVGHQSMPLQKESIQTLYIYMKHSLDVDEVFRCIAHRGIQHENPTIRQQIVHCFPTLLFPEFKSEDFFDIINSLAVNLTETSIDQDVILRVLNSVKDFLGKDTFTKYVNRLPPPLRHNYYKCIVSNSGKTSAKQAAATNHDKNSLKYPLVENTSVDHGRHAGNFAKSGHYDTVPSRRRPHANVYSSLGQIIPFDGKTANKNALFELSFIPSYVIEDLSSNEHSVRLEAVESLREVLANLKEPALIKENMVPLLSLLQPVFDDKNYRVACGALSAFSVMISKIGPDINNFVKLFVFAISRKLGNVKDSVRSQCYKVLLQIMELVGRQKVLSLFWEKLSHKQSKVREDFLCVIIATLLTSLKSKNFSDLDFDLICNHVAARLTDNQQVVRQAALDCIAVLGHILGTTNKKILSAVDSVELRHDNASGIMSAVHARLLRKQLPRLTEDTLVEYARFSSSSSLNSPLGADLQWIYAAEKPKKASSSKSVYTPQEKDVKRSATEEPRQSKEDMVSDTDIFRKTRRHLSAGKHRQFPWASQDELSNSKHPISAPNPSQPPIRPRNTWGPESEISSKSSQAYEPTAINNGPSYQELYKRKKEAHANKSSASSNRSLAAVSRTDSGYQPSFASKGFSPSTASSLQGQAGQEPLPFSNSCPSSFFDKNPPPVHSRRSKQKAVLPVDDTPSSGHGSEESVSPIRLKPALARSAPKRRDALAASKEFLKSEDQNDVPVKLKNVSASPRFDRMVGSMSADPARPILKPSPLTDISRSSALLNHENDAPTGYTPSGLQRKPAKVDGSTRSSLILERGQSKSNRNDGVVSNQENGPGKTTAQSRPSPRPVVPSHFSPARHRSHEDTAEFQLNALNSIRRSAQNKRDRMRSQPGSEDGFSNSFSEFSTPKPSKVPTNASQPSDYDPAPTTRASSQPVTSNELVSSSSVAATETPAFKYNPNSGVTFESKKVDTNVSVVGVRYPTQAFSGLSSSVNTGSKSPNNNVVGSAIASNSAVSIGSKSSANFVAHDRHRQHGGSSLGMSALVSSPDLPANRTFNVQGKGVFMSPSTTSLSSNDLSPAVSPKDSSHRMTSNDRTKQKLLEAGVTGIAVKQSAVTSQDFLSRGGAGSDVQVSLSASLRERRERQKEVLSKNPRNLSKTLFRDDEPTTSLAYNPTDDYENITRTMSKRTMNEAKLTSNKAATLPRRAPDSSRRAVLDGVGSSAAYKAGSGPPLNALSPLDQPEKGLSDALSSLESASSEEWEVVTQAMYTIRRLVTHHPHVVAPRFHDVITSLNKYVPSLRSQVSKASAQAITDLYTHLKKPVVDTDLDVTIRTLLKEHGKQMSFIRDETDKTLQAIINRASASKLLNALLNAGLRHKNKGVRSTTAKFCARLVDKMGPGKSLSGLKDTTDRLLEAVAAFINDGSPDVRFYGRYIVNELMAHDDFNRSVDRCLSADSAQSVKTAASTITQRGLGSLSSVGSRKGESGRNRNGASAGAPSERISPSMSSSIRRKGAGGRAFNEQEQEELKSLCDDLSSGSLNERKSAIATLFEKLQRDRRFVEEHIVKIMGAFTSMLTTAQTKLNSLALDSLPRLIVDLHPHFRDVTPQLVPALFKQVSSKQHSEVALENIDCLVKFVEPLWIIQHFADAAKQANAKAKPIALTALAKLVGLISRRKSQVIERHVLPVFWDLLLSQGASGGALLRNEIASLARSLYNVFGSRLIELAESKNLAAKTKDVLGARVS